MIKKLIENFIIESKLILVRLVKPKFLRLRGIKLNVKKGNVSSQVRDAICRGTYEKPEADIVENKIAKNDIVLELGTGSGFISMLCAKKIGPSRVFTYEPTPYTANLALNNFKANKMKIKLEQKVLGNIHGKTKIFRNAGFESNGPIKREEDAESIEVDCVNVDSVMQKIRPTFLVVDIEGGEKDLIPLIDFTSVKKINIELHPHIIGDKEVSKIITKLLDIGFDMDLLISSKKVMYFYKSRKEL